MAKNEAKIKFTAETGEFNKAIKEANSEMSSLRAELNLNAAEMKNTGVSVEGLEKKHSLLEGQLQASQNKTEALTQKVAKAAEIFGDNSEEVTKLKTQLANAQTAEEKIKKAISDCESELTKQAEAAEEAESATAKLTDKIDKQETELKKLKKEYVETVLKYGETSDEAKDLSRKIEDLSGELKDSKDAFADASKKADDLDKSLENAGDAAANTEGGFTIAKGVISDLASNVIQAAISKVSEFVDYLMELPEATREIRQDMATLETSFERQGFSVDTATQTWKDLYGVFGEDDRAVEASNLIAKMSKNQEDLNDWVTITQGVWGSYQDSLPVEGLAEASMESAKTGQVTGVLADALNWSSEAAKMFAGYMSEDVTTAEDAFNVALSECTTEAERQALITETLTKLYGGAAAEYEKASGAQIDAKNAAAENILTQNELADTVEPLTTAWQGMKNEMLTGMLPAVQKFSDWGVSALGWMKEHPVAMKIIGAVLAVIATALTTLAVAVGVYTVAQWAMNAAVLANPITWVVVGIVAAIAALIAIIVLIIEYWEQIKAAVVNACSAIWNAIKTAWDWIANLFSSIGNWIYTYVIQPVVNFFVGLWDAVKKIWDNIVNGIKVAILFIGSILKAAFDIITLPFRFIWENCKKYVFAAFEWIKEKISAAVQAIKNIFSAIGNFFAGVWNGVKNVFAPVGQWFKEKFQAAKQGIQNAWASVTNFFSNVWSGVKTAFSNVGSWFKDKFQAAKQGVQNAWSNVTNFFSNVKNKIVNGFANIKEKISAPFKAAIDKIKGFFNNLKLKFPNIKMPHFSIEGKFSLSPPSVPKLKIDWYKDGGIFTKPTLFNTPYGFKGVGEAGAEAVLPIDRLQGYISNAIDKSVQAVNLNSLAAAIEDLANRPVELNINGKQFAYATASDTDSVGGMRNTFKSRGLMID